jgi:hypothetical protein
MSRQHIERCDLRRIEFDLQKLRHISPSSSSVLEQASPLFLNADLSVAQYGPLPPKPIFDRLEVLSPTAGRNHVHPSRYAAPG